MLKKKKSSPSTKPAIPVAKPALPFGPGLLKKGKNVLKKSTVKKTGLKLKKLKSIKKK